MVRMTEYCYNHNKKKTAVKCDSCNKNLCEECANTYWHTNTLGNLFQAQTSKQEELFLCDKCLRNARIKNGLIPGFLLILFLGIIITLIIVY